MKRELLGALTGQRQPLTSGNRAAMVCLGVVLIFPAIVILHATFVNKHYVAFALLLIPTYIVIEKGSLLFRIAAVSPAAVPTSGSDPTTT
jgi:hypothetical protein